MSLATGPVGPTAAAAGLHLSVGEVLGLVLSTLVLLGAMVAVVLVHRDLKSGGERSTEPAVVDLSGLFGDVDKAEGSTIDPPPSPEEVRQAALHPWPGHSMTETILRHRAEGTPGPDVPEVPVG